ncbi:hypothetical protein [Thalassotalea marina]|uniref:Uncharacterized protein n=1 Tax=Thalassotalea marina TaxID=1673741 RepID=A0A919EII4_9GAMM|nr:hypothetical protein [Thalassotalea marina]GHF87755.1 hypothetical protein GCM10017161_14250 [Thalassotalea marina]
MSFISKQERNLLITAKTFLAVGLFNAVDAIYTSFDLPVNAFMGLLGAALLLLAIYWTFKNLQNVTDKYSDEYLKHIYQQSYSYAAIGAAIPLFTFILFDDWLAHYFTIKYSAKLCIGTMLSMQGGYILWRNFIDNRSLNKDELQDGA